MNRRMFEWFGQFYKPISGIYWQGCKYWTAPWEVGRIAADPKTSQWGLRAWALVISLVLYDLEPKRSSNRVWAMLILSTSPWAPRRRAAPARWHVPTTMIVNRIRYAMITGSGTSAFCSVCFGQTNFKPPALRRYLNFCFRSHILYPCSCLVYHIPLWGQGSGNINKSTMNSLLLIVGNITPQHLQCTYKWNGLGHIQHHL